MEIDAKLGMQLAIMLATIAGGYSVVKNQLARVMEDLEHFIARYEKSKAAFDQRLDEAESQRAVFTSQIDVLKEINSVGALRDQNREMATIQAQLKVMQSQIDHLSSIHNGKHPAIGVKE
jgi:predicted  nucleic acid-binding Zn-ribbon protein|tara:strand:- start:1195 stop:1554 length:360 start_codon:yes stop_codon:yes gene_type:complete